MDAELKAMNEAFDAIKGLDDDAKQRVINWLQSKFSIKIVHQESKALENFQGNNRRIEAFDSIGELFSAVNPTSDPDRVLVVATFLQISEDKKELTGREINKELQHLGYKVGNITETINRLKGRKPQLMIQTRKEGAAKQAQKKYKVTREGVKNIQDKLESKK